KKWGPGGPLFSSGTVLTHDLFLLLHFAPAGVRVEVIRLTLGVVTNDSLPLQGDDVALRRSADLLPLLGVAAYLVRLLGLLDAILFALLHVRLSIDHFLQRIG